MDVRRRRGGNGSNSNNGGDDFKLTYEQKKRLMKAQEFSFKESKVVSVITNIIWAVVGIAVVVYFDVINAIKYDHRIDRFWLQGSTALVLFAAIVVFVAVFVYQKLLKRNYDVELPWAVPIATVSGLLSIVGFMIAFYPAYGIVTIPLVVVCSMSFILTLATITSALNL
eukprot:m.132811 g.132811  ORF g.132811 m.132811 type:complete len:169 (-) comp13093_c0_seq3:3148-3654(-)